MFCVLLKWDYKFLFVVLSFAAKSNFYFGISGLELESQFDSTHIHPFYVFNLLKFYRP